MNLEAQTLHQPKTLGCFGRCRRVQLAALFPAASPGNLGRGALQDLPSRAAAAGAQLAAEQRRASGAHASTSQVGGPACQQ